MGRKKMLGIRFLKMKSLVEVNEQAFLLRRGVFGKFHSEVKMLDGKKKEKKETNVKSREKMVEIVEMELVLKEKLKVKKKIGYFNA